MRNFTRKQRLGRVIDFTAAIHKLPEDLYDFYTAKDGTRIMPYYVGDGVNTQFYASRLMTQDKLLRELKKFIKLAYGTEDEYFTAVNKIVLHNPVYESKDAPLYDDANILWRKGRRELIVLIADMIAEETEREKLGEDQSQALRYAGFVVVFSISLLTIWLSPAEIFSTVFNPESLLAARVCLSFTVASASMIILASNKWKELVGVSLIPFLIAILPFLKNERKEEMDIFLDKKIVADTVKKANKPLQRKDTK